MTYRSTSILLKTRRRLGPVTKKFPTLHRALVGIYHVTILEVIPRLSSLFKARPVQGNSVESLERFIGQQKTLTVDVNLPVPNTVDQLKSFFLDAGCEIREGGWTIYIPPSDSLRRLIPQLGWWPNDAGLKILKDFQSPDNAVYTPNHLRPTPGAAPVRARTPLPRALLRVSAYLYRRGLSPKVYDLVALSFASKTLTAFVCAHVTGRSAQISEHAQFIDRLKSVLEEGAIEPTHGQYKFSSDFAQPDCNGNLIHDVKTGEPLYIDFQSFRIRDEVMLFSNWVRENAKTVGFGGVRMGRSADEYLYQTIPGLGDAKRGTSDRWHHIDEVLNHSDVSLNQRVVFDVGCNSGLMSYYALARGAKWCFGWDKPDTAKAAADLVPMLGATRFTAIGENIGEDTNFADAIPAAFRETSGGILFLFSICHHIGFPPGLAALPWEICVFEGSAGDTVDSVKRFFEKAVNKISVLATAQFRDGDSPPRPLVVVTRQARVNG